MSHPSRPGARGPARRKRRQIAIEAPQALEGRQLLAPVMSINTLTATYNETSNVDNNGVTTSSGTIDITETPSPYSAAGFTSVAQLTSNAAFGGDIVNIQAGPGGDFGKGVYAISRGAGPNADSGTAINRPGVIYRVDPATGRTSVFFDLNTVIQQIDPGAPLGNGALPSTGLVNWYDVAFDPNGVFDGQPSMFVSSVSYNDPAKNAVYRISPSGQFMGLFLRFSPGTSLSNLAVQPSALLVPPASQQSFLKGLFVGDADSTGGNPVLFFNANSFRPGQDVLSLNQLGVVATPMNAGPQVGLTSADAIYPSPVYSAFTDFGQPAGGGLPPAPGLSGVQGLGGELLINQGAPVVNNINFLNNTYYSTDPNAASPDLTAAITTPFRRFYDIAYDKYGYFSYGSTVTVGGFGTATTIDTIPPVFAGSVFVSDLSAGLSVQLPAGDTPIWVPVNGPGSASFTFDTNTTPNTLNAVSVTDSNLGGRIVRIGPDGVVTPFAEGFNVTNFKDANDFIQSTLSISFSADGTTLYAADNDGIWQFKTVTSLAGSTAGSLVGLNDLRSLGVPYEGQDLAVAVVDTGVDASNPRFNGQVAPGKNIITNGFGNDDTAGLPNGHGTQLAGIVSQFVPQSTIVPVNVFTPNQAVLSPGVGGTTTQAVWSGTRYVAQNPYVQDPLRPNTLNRVVNSLYGFGTNNSFQTEGVAFRKFPQVVLSLKSEFAKLRKVGIAPIAAAGQFGSPIGTAAGSAAIGDYQGAAMPAVLNEVISVSGTYSFPFATGPTSPPTDPAVGALPRPLGPVLVTNQTDGTILGANLIALTAPDLLIFQDRLLAAANRTMTTDFVAPALDIPTYSRTALGVTTTNVGGSGLMVFQEGGTSYSAAMVSGAFSVVASALNYWNNLANSGGVTADAYLNVPVGTNVLNFGPHAIGDLSTYSNPDSVYGILQWTAVPVRDQPTTLDTTTPTRLFPNAGGPFPKYSRIDVGNAVAAIEGTEALNYLINSGKLSAIDANNNGLITAQEIQDFVDQAATTGNAEAGAMARLLGGTARISTTGFQSTAAGESPDQPDVLQRRFNFFDYAADGQLDGAISIQQFQMLAHNLLPSPDAFVVVDRQRASGNGYLLDPSKERNFVALQYTKPTYAFVPAGIARRFRNISPDRFGFGRGLPLGSQDLVYSLFGEGATQNGNGAGGKGQGDSGGNGGGPGSNSVKPVTTPTKPTQTTPTQTTPTTPTTTTPSYQDQVLSELARAIAQSRVSQQNQTGGDLKKILGT